MNQRIDQFRETIRLKVMQVDSDLSALKAKIDAKAETVERDARDSLAAVTKRIEQGETKTSAARLEVETWLKQQRSLAESAIAELKAKGKSSKVKINADLAERYAMAAVDVAAAAINSAEQAALEAWLARRQADRAGKN